MEKKLETFIDSKKDHIINTLYITMGTFSNPKFSKPVAEYINEAFPNIGDVGKLIIKTPPVIKQFLKGVDKDDNYIAFLLIQYQFLESILINLSRINYLENTSHVIIKLDFNKDTECGKFHTSYGNYEEVNQYILEREKLLQKLILTFYIDSICKSKTRVLDDDFCCMFDKINMFKMKDIEIVEDFKVIEDIETLQRVC